MCSGGGIRFFCCTSLLIHQTWVIWLNRAEAAVVTNSLLYDRCCVINGQRGSAGQIWQVFLLLNISIVRVTKVPWSLLKCLQRKCHLANNMLTAAVLMWNMQWSEKHLCLPAMSISFCFLSKLLGALCCFCHGPWKYTRVNNTHVEIAHRAARLCGYPGFSLQPLGRFKGW